MSVYFGFPIVIAAVIIAQTADATVPSANWWQPIVQTGALGCMLIWFMVINKKDMSANTRAMNILSRSINALIIHSKHQDEALKEMATELKAEAEEELKANAAKTITG